MNIGSSKANQLPHNINNKQTSNNNNENPSSPLLGIASNILNRKFADAYAESNKLKLPIFQELTKIVYEYNHLKYILLTRDKILQVNPEQHLLTEGGMLNLRTLAHFREESAQAKINYQAIAENIKKLLVSTSAYYQCTLPNRAEMTQIKNSLFTIFQELKNAKKTKTLASSEVTEREKIKLESIVNESKENFLDIISFVVPTQTLRKSINREKTINQLASIAKEQIRQAFANSKKELEFLQSRAHICQKTLENERIVKLEKEKEIEELKIELITNQKLIEDLQGLKAATEMENLGLHSKIKTSQSDEERQIYESQIERLRLQIEELTLKAGQHSKLQQNWKEYLQNCQFEHEVQRQKLNLRFQQTYKAMQHQNEELKQQLQHSNSQKMGLQSTLNIKKTEVLKVQHDLQELEEKVRILMNENSLLKTQNEHHQAQILRIENVNHRDEQYVEQYHKLQEEVDSLHSQNDRLHECLKDQEQKKSALEITIDQLCKISEQHEQEKQKMHEELEFFTNENEIYRNMVATLEGKMRQIQEEYEYISAEKDYYQKYYRTCDNSPKEEKAMEIPDDILTD